VFWQNFEWGTRRSDALDVVVDSWRISAAVGLPPLRRIEDRLTGIPADTCTTVRSSKIRVEKVEAICLEVSDERGAQDMLLPELRGLRMIFAKLPAPLLPRAVLSGHLRDRPPVNLQQVLE